MKKIIFILAGLIIIPAAIFYFSEKPGETPILQEAYLGNAALNMELADTPEKMTLGLSGRKSIEPNQGMLFSYSEPGIYSFWMKDMKFPIDIIWLDADKKIVDITKSVASESYPEKITSTPPAQYVVETNAGWSDKNNIKIGDLAIFPWEYAAKISAKENLIKVTLPKIGDKISSPLAIAGEARGNWFFEASFPIQIQDSKGNILVSQPAQALSDPPDGEASWMTTEFVPFSASLAFIPPAGIDTGFVVLKKDNPSGLPQNDDQIQIPIRFR